MNTVQGLSLNLSWPGFDCVRLRRWNQLKILWFYTWLHAFWVVQATWPRATGPGVENGRIRHRGFTGDADVAWTWTSGRSSGIDKHAIRSMTAAQAARWNGGSNWPLGPARAVAVKWAIRQRGGTLNRWGTRVMRKKNAKTP